MDVWQDDQAVHVRASVPGFSAEEVEITVDAQGVLTLKGERKVDQERKESDYMLREMRWTSFQRQLALPGEVRPDEATADFKDGILSITIPKVKAAAPARVKVPVKSKQ
jgi:HSP20 family protein